MDSNQVTALWSGRVDVEDGAEGLRIHQLVKPFIKCLDSAASPCPQNEANTQPAPSASLEKGITFIGFASDLGVQRNQGRVGARKGPNALRRSLSNLAVHFPMKLYDAGNVDTDAFQGEADALASTQQQFASQVSDALMQNQFVIGLGGGHEIGWASYQGCRQFLDQRNETRSKIGIINFDAHFDLRKPASKSGWIGSSGTPFYQVAESCAMHDQAFHYACIGISEAANTQALFHYAEEKAVPYLMDYQCEPKTSDTFIHEFISKIDYLYLTVCLDALPASVAPGVSAPSAYGISLPFVIQAIEQIHQACHQYNVQWLMSDIAELNPDYDIDHQTSKVAARIAYEIIKLQQ